MTKPSASINTLQVSMLLITTIGIQTHVIIIPALLESAGRDSWISAIASGAISFIGIGLIYYVMRKTKQENLIVWTRQHIGVIPSYLIALLICVALLISTYIGIKDTVNWTKVTYLVNTPEFVIEFSIILLGFLAALAGIEAIAITNGILLPLVIFFGHIVMIGNMPRKDYTFLFPLFQNGYEHFFHGMLYSTASMIEILALLFLQHHLKKPMRYIHIFIIQLILVILMLSPLTGAIAAFGPETAQKLRYPAFEQWRLLILMAGYIDQVDFLSIYQWLVGTFIRMSIGMYLIVEFLNIKKRRAWALFGLAVLLMILVQFPMGDVDFWLLLYYVLLPVNFIIFISILLLMLLFVLWKGVRSQRRM